MKTRATWILFVAAVLAGAYFLFIEQPRHRSGQERERSDQRLTSIAADTVVAMSIERDEITIRFERTAGDWRLTAPVEDRADPGAVNILLHTLINSDVERRLPLGKGSLDEYGLDSPAVRLRLSSETEADVLSIEIGERSVTRSHCYAILDGDGDILLIPASVRRYALRTLPEFRDKKIAIFATQAITRLELRSRGRSLVWHKQGGPWVTTVGVDTLRGDTDAIESVLGRLHAMRSTEIIESTPETIDEYLGAPERMLSLSSGADSVPITFRFGAPRDDGTCYVLAAQASQASTGSRIDRVHVGILDVFDTPFADLRDRHVLRFHADALGKVSLAVAGTQVSILHDGEEWSFINPGFAAIDQVAVSVFLRELSNLKFRRIEDEHFIGTGHGLENPSYRLALFDRSGALVDEVITGEAASGANIHYATSHSSGCVGIMDGEPLAQIHALFEDFRVR